MDERRVVLGSLFGEEALSEAELRERIVQHAHTLVSSLEQVTPDLSTTRGRTLMVKEGHEAGALLAYLDLGKLFAGLKLLREGERDDGKS